MDEPYLLAAARYVELNPVRAKLASEAEEWPWSSARAHLSGRDDPLTNVSPLLAIVADWRGFLDSALREEELRDLRAHARVQAAPSETQRSSKNSKLPSAAC